MKITPKYLSRDIRVMLDSTEVALIGHPSDFYVYVHKNGKSYYSEWMKGKSANKTWFAMKQLASPRISNAQQFIDEGIKLFHKLGPVNLDLLSKKG